jgi:hypothetical protein
MALIEKKAKVKVANTPKKKISTKKIAKQGSYESVMKAIELAQKNPISFINQW